MSRPFALVLLTALSLGFPLGVSAQDQMGVKPGDQVTTRFNSASGQPISAIEGTRLVDRDGNLYYPFVGSVHVDGLDAERIRNLLVQKFQPFYTDPVVNVNVLLRVNITGLVGSPGHYFMDPTTTLMDALAIAGGIGSEFESAGSAGGAADPGNVRLVRNGETQIIDMRPQSVDPAVFDMRIQSGDWIHVPVRPRSRWRDEIQFWGGLVSLAAGLVILIGVR
jgi:polysaccharide biosynthesis/export protein